MNDETFTTAGLKDKLKKLKSADTELGVVKGGSEVDYQNMVTVLDILQQLEITKVGLATESVAAGQPQGRDPAFSSNGMQADHPVASIHR